MPDWPAIVTEFGPLAYRLVAHDADAADCVQGVGLLGEGGSAQASLLEALGDQAKAKSFRAVIKMSFVAPPPGVPPMPEQRMFMQGENARVETGDSITVTDSKRLVVFNTKTKVAQTLDLTKGMPQVPKGIAEGVRRICDAVAGKAKVMPVAAVEIGGKMRPVFKVSEVTFMPGQTGDVTYWLDEERKLPLRYEMVFVKPVAITTTTDYLGFDEKLDAKLFDMTIPADYKQEEFKMPVAPKVGAAPETPAAVAPAQVATPELKEP